MSISDSTEHQQKVKEAKAIIRRVDAGRITSADEKTLKPFTKAGEPDWRKPAERYLKHLQGSREQALATYLDSGMLFDFDQGISAAPNDLLRGSLFAPISKGRRKLLNRQNIGSSPDGLIDFSYSGAQLDQGDLDTLLTLLRVLSDGSKTGNISKITDENGRHEYTRVRFTRYGFLKELKKSNANDNYKRLDDSLRRLGGELSIEIKGKGKLDGPILGKRFVDEESGDMMVDINQDFSTLFKGDQFALVDMNQRLSLKTGFQKWLHAFVLTHSGESYFSAKQLMEKSGSASKRVSDWQARQATPAFEKLTELGVIKNLVIKGQLYKWSR